MKKSKRRRHHLTPTGAVPTIYGGSERCRSHGSGIGPYTLPPVPTVNDRHRLVYTLTHTSLHIYLNPYLRYSRTPSEGNWSKRCPWVPRVFLFFTFLVMTNRFRQDDKMAYPLTLGLSHFSLPGRITVHRSFVVSDSRFSPRNGTRSRVSSLQQVLF